MHAWEWQGQAQAAHPCTIQTGVQRPKQGQGRCWWKNEQHLASLNGVQA